MSTSIHVKTESADHYDYAIEGDMSNIDISAFLKNELGDEFDYITEVNVVLSNGEKVDTSNIETI